MSDEMRSAIMCGLCGCAEYRDDAMTAFTTINYAPGACRMSFVACARCQLEVQAVAAAHAASHITPFKMREARLRGDDPIAAAIRFHSAIIAKARRGAFTLVEEPHASEHVE